MHRRHRYKRTDQGFKLNKRLELQKPVKQSQVHWVFVVLLLAICAILITDNYQLKTDLAAAKKIIQYRYFQYPTWKSEKQKFTDLINLHQFDSNGIMKIQIEKFFTHKLNGKFYDVYQHTIYVIAPTDKDQSNQIQSPPSGIQTLEIQRSVNAP